MANVNDRAQNTLNLLMPLKRGARPAVEALFTQLGGAPGGSPLDRALKGLGNVHFARFVFLDNNTLATLTTFDGEFGDYIMSFVEHVGPRRLSTGSIVITPSLLASSAPIRDVACSTSRTRFTLPERRRCQRPQAPRGRLSTTTI